MILLTKEFEGTKGVARGLRIVPWCHLKNILTCLKSFSRHG